MESSNNRILWIDALKAFAILIVILGHVLQSLDATGVLYKYIYVVHMPLFMTISGFCSYKPVVTLDAVKRRFFQLVIPFFCWPLVWRLIKFDFSGIIDYYVHLPLFPDTGLWFLFILFLITVVEFVRSRIVGKLHDRRYSYECSVTLAVVALLILYAVYKKASLPGNWLNFTALYYPYFILGGLMRRYQQTLLKCFVWAGPVGLAIYFMSAFCFGLAIVQPVFAVCGIIGFFWLFNMTANRQLPGFVSYLGMTTLGIYAVHQPVVYYVKDIVYSPLWLNIVITFVITMLIAIASIEILKLSSITRRMFLGMNN